MTSSNEEQHRPGPRADGPADEDIRIPRRSVMELLPRRSLMKAVLLLVVLAAIIGLQRNSTRMIRSFTDVLYPAAEPRPAAPTERRVRMEADSPARKPAPESGPSESMKQSAGTESR